MGPLRLKSFASSDTIFSSDIFVPLKFKSSALSGAFWGAAETARLKSYTSSENVVLEALTLKSSTAQPSTEPKSKAGYLSATLKRTYAKGSTDMH